MSETNSVSTKPYLFRAIFEWAEDNGLTPQVLVDARVDGVMVPEEHVVDGKIVLNISSSATMLHTMDNDCLSFSARFNGVEQNIYLPMNSIAAIFARENSQGIFFDDQEEDQTAKIIDGEEPDDDPTPPTSDNKPSKKNHLKIVK